MNTTKVSRKQIAAIIAATFPNYTGRTFKVQACERAFLGDLNWSGGTRSQYRACTLDGTSLGSADRFNAMHPANNAAEGKELPIVPGCVLVEHAIFCGKDMGLRLYVHPSDMPKYLAA